jgi:magnesium transporter
VAPIPRHHHRADEPHRCSTRLIAVPTAVTGFYGQNLPYPGFATHAGFYASSAVILVLSGLLYLTFKAKDWL